MPLKIGKHGMTDPDDVCEAPYRAIHDLLADIEASVGRELTVREALDELREVRQWADALSDLIRKNNKTP